MFPDRTNSSTALFVTTRGVTSTGLFAGDFNKSFQEKFPKIRVRCVVLEKIEGSYFVRHELSRESTDIAMLSLTNETDFQSLAMKGLIAPLDDWIDPLTRKNFLEIGLKKGTFKGRFYAFPKNISLGCLFGRRDILDRHGFDMPKTWEELVLFAKEIVGKEKNISGLAFRGKNGLAKSFIEFLWSNGGKIYGRGDVVLASPQAEETLHFFLKLICQWSLVSPASLSQEPWKLTMDFCEGKYLFIQGASSNLGHFKKTFRTQADQKLKFSLTPVGPSGKFPGSFPEGSYFVVPARTRFKSEAEKLIRFFSDEKASGPFGEKHFLPLSRFRLNFTHIKPSMPWYDFRSYQMFAEARRPEGDMPISIEVLGVIEKHLIDCLLRRVSPAAALKLMTRDIKQLDSGTLPARRFSETVAYIADHLGEPLSVSKIAGICGLDRSSFSRLFTKEMGKNPVRYIQETRIAQAQRLLEISDDSIGEIAKKSGFENAKYFYRLFKRLTGKTPTRYKRESG